MFYSRKRLPFGAILLAVGLFLTSTVFAQTETARLQGTVTDAQGAVVAGAIVKATSLGTNRSVEATTDAEGNYSILSLQPGRYQVEVSQANFKTTQQEITLEVAQNATLPIALEAGAVSETVTINSDVPLVDANTSAIGNVVSGRQAVELPLNGRNVLELARLSPGVTQGIVGGFASGAGGDAETYRGGNTGGAAISVNGQRTQANNFLLDGVDNNESLVNTINIFPSAEATQEFRVQTSVATAEFGRGGGAIINTVIKSGSNDFHGSTYLFIRNSALDARPAFFESTRKPTVNGRLGDVIQRTPQFRRGQFGATFGGPVIIPGFGEGTPIFRNLKDKVFFFFSYDGLRQFLPVSTDTATVPTVAFRNGDFSQLLNPASSGLSSAIQLRDPLTGANILNNRLDLLGAGRLNRAALNYLRAFPLPNNGSQVLGNYINTRDQLSQQNVYDFRIDANLTDANQMFVRSSIGRYSQETTSRLPALPSGFGSGSNPTTNNAIVVGLNSAISPTLFNELRLQYNNLRFGYEPPFSDTPIAANLGIVNANRDSSLGGGALIGGYNGQLEYTGDFGPYRVPQRTYQLVDSISYARGPHTFKFGGTILRRDVNLFRPTAGKGYFFLYGNGDFTQCRRNDTDPESASGTTRFEQADLLIGFACNYQIGNQVGVARTRNWENALFAQDDWKATKKLTLNLGLRYEYLTNPGEIDGRQSNFNLATGGLTLPGEKGNSQVNTDKNNFGPRVGLAYDVFGNGKTAIRAGYGLFYFLDRGGIDNQLAQNAPYAGSAVYDYRDGYRITLSGQAPLNSNNNTLATQPLPLPATVNTSSAFLNNPVGFTVLSIKADNKISNVQQFNAQVVQQLDSSTALSVGYVGTRGNNLSLYYNLNGNALTTATAIPCPIRGRNVGQCYPGLGAVNVRDDNGRSRYDSLQVQLERRFSKGWQYIGSYTFSKTRDNGNGSFNNTANGLNYVEQYANSSADYPHVFSYQTVYEIPFGRGRQFGTDIPKVVDLLIGGLQFNAIFRAQSGNPFDVRSPDRRLVNVTGDPYTGNFFPFLRRAAFSVAPGNAIGNLERNSLRSPPTYQLNLGLTKNFNITDTTKIQFRAEGFNVFNTIQAGNPNTDLNNANARDGFGTIRGTTPFSNRQLQFGARLEF